MNFVSIGKTRWVNLDLVTEAGIIEEIEPGWTREEQAEGGKPIKNVLRLYYNVANDYGTAYANVEEDYAHAVLHALGVRTKTNI